MISKSQLRRLSNQLNFKSVDINESEVDPNTTYIIKIIHKEDLYYAADRAEYCEIDSEDISIYKGRDLDKILPYLEFEYELVPYWTE